MAGKLGVKRKHIYRLHRSEKLDKRGRPAILLNGRITKSLIWYGTTKLDELNKEQPLTLKINNNLVYFYGNAIDVVETKDLQGDWMNIKTKKPYILSLEQQDAVLKKFISCSQLADPYLKINNLTTAIEEKNIQYAEEIYQNQIIKDENQVLKDEKLKLGEKYQKLKQENQKLILEQEKIKIENQSLILENETLNSENEMLKLRTKVKTISEHQQE
ncbi:MAG: hypothetical protein REH79_02295 [Spiroplasma sp.]|nr:hypothetical protein [Spiroplasma sp.]